MSRDEVSLAARGTLSAPGTVTFDCTGFKLAVDHVALTALQVQ